MRVSESAFLSSDSDARDPVVQSVRARARAFQGWRNPNTTVLEPLMLQRYGVDGFYNYHLDWDELLEHGNRVTTFMVYLVGDCDGGGTNFSYLPVPEDERWCGIIECGEGRDGYRGVTFKPLKGSAVYWDNIRPNGTGYGEVYREYSQVQVRVRRC